VPAAGLSRSRTLPRCLSPEPLPQRLTGPGNAGHSPTGPDAPALAATDAADVRTAARPRPGGVQRTFEAMTSPSTRPIPQPGAAGAGALKPWLLRQLPLGWLLQLNCPLCRRSLSPGQAGEGLCEPCRQRLALPPQGLQGAVPLPWWSSGAYADQLRRTLLSLRRQPRLDALRPLSQPLRAMLSGLPGQPWLVPIPSWKLRANPLPELLVASLCQGGNAKRAALLERTRPVLGQHHLRRQLRLSNQADSFRCLRPPLPGEARLHPLLIVDDILTTGATACSAAACLEAAGWRVMGVLCLGRTPLPAGRDLRSANRSARAALPGRDSSVGRAGD